MEYQPELSSCSWDRPWGRWALVALCLPRVSLPQLIPAVWGWLRTAVPSGQLSKRCPIPCWSSLEHFLTGNFCFPTHLQALPKGWAGLHHDPGQTGLASVETEELGRGKCSQTPKEPSLKDVRFCWVLVPFSLSCPCIQPFPEFWRSKTPPSSSQRSFQPLITEVTQNNAVEQTP